MHSTSVRTAKSSSYVRRAFPSVFFQTTFGTLDHTFIKSPPPPPWGFLKIKPPLDFPFQKERHNVRVIEDLCQFSSSRLEGLRNIRYNKFRNSFTCHKSSKHGMNAWVVRLGVSSISLALVLPQVNKQMYTLQASISVSKTVFTNRGPAKCAPVLANGYPSLNLNSGISDDGSTLYGLPSSLLHTTQLQICFRMTCRPLGSQKRDFNSVSVFLTPLCITLWLQSLIMSLVIW